MKQPQGWGPHACRLYKDSCLQVPAPDTGVLGGTASMMLTPRFPTVQKPRRERRLPSGTMLHRASVGMREALSLDLGQCFLSPRHHLNTAHSHPGYPLTEGSHVPVVIHWLIASVPTKSELDAGHCGGGKKEE